MSKMQVVAVLVAFIFILSGITYTSYWISIQPQPVARYFVDYPKGTAIFSIEKGNWTASIVGSDPLLTFNSSNFTEVSEWAMNQTATSSHIYVPKGDSPYA